MRGFTLLEVMVSLAIMAGVVLTVITSFNYHLSVVTRDKEETIAMLLARAKFDDPDLFQQEKRSGTFAPEWPDIHWQLTEAPAPLKEIKKLVFTVSWGGERNSLALVKYMAKL
jgi:general secretion pathway protein I